MQRLNVGSNSFYGSIPNEICLLQNLGEIYLDENKISGSIPSCIGNLSSLQRMILNSNKLALIPSSLGNEELCGKSIFKVPPCTSNSSKKSRTKIVLLQFILPASALMNDLMKYFREDLHRRLLSRDFKKQINGIEMLHKALPSIEKEIVEILDILRSQFR
ncbi:Protein MOR1 [Camellia lanceoleosa]|uniref:Protein MOR1 n=1 Tax=Camellia lanceoleosa TaxID=1840588 RepID=A0ACC0IEW6_9ERIC|nr:Protein MOR1 [Camellia lanceoleosa]